MYYIFGAFNGAALVHMFLLAPETKGFTLEEMDEVFDSGRPAWKKFKKESRLEQLQRDIEAGKIKIGIPGGATAETTPSEERTEAEPKN